VGCGVNADAIAMRSAQDHHRAMATRWTVGSTLAACFALAGCGVGVSLGVGIGPNDDPPSVSLAAAPQSAAAGERIGLVAAADDDFRVVEVRFYRVDVGGDTLLGIDGSAPYALETTLPTGSGAGSEVRYFARAVDDAGQRTDSQMVGVTVR
jgi:hypothetical protein